MEVLADGGALRLGGSGTARQRRQWLGGVGRRWQRVGGMGHM
jgi:hypothetical protein